MFHFMGIVEAGLWGLAGGGVAGLVALAADVGAEHKWPWRDNEYGIGPWLFIIAVGIIVGAVVAGAAHSQMTGPWPALLMGISAPAIVRGGLSKFEVSPNKAEPVPVQKAEEHAV
jgi:hypothetical protein